MGLAALLERVVGRFLAGVRAPSAAELFRRADRLRHEGRYDEAGALIERGLRRWPRSAAGHLLAGYLHLASHRLEPAREAFLTVLDLDPDHPRALLGLARIALAQGDAASARPYMDRALQYHTGFAEARTLGAIVGTEPSDVGPAREGAGARDRILARLESGVVFSECDAGRESVLAHHVIQVARLASATLARAGLGPLRSAVIEGARETTLLQSDARFVLALSVPTGTAVSEALAELRRSWIETARTR